MILATGRKQHRRPIRNGEHGFSLTEVLVVLAVIGLTAAIALPTLQRSQVQARADREMRSVRSLFDFARSEAIKRGSSVSITSTSGDSNWKDGWSVADGGETIRVYAAQKGQHTLVSDGGDSTYSYDPQGFINNNDTISLCLNSGATGRRITIAASGHAHVDGSYVCP